MALVKSPPSNLSFATPEARDDPAASFEVPSSASGQHNAPEQPVRRGTDFGRPTKNPSADTYVKLRFSDTPDMPETWFKLHVRPDGVHAFEPTSREHPVVLLMSKGDSKLRMYHFDDAGNFDGEGPKRFEGVLAEIQVRKRRDSTPENPQFFLTGMYFPEQDRGERELRGNMVGAQSKDIMQGLSQSAYIEWKATQTGRENSAPTPAPAPKELVAGQELEFGI